MSEQASMSPERYARIRKLLSLRQPSLTLCLEQLNKPHNVSAIVRSCDAVGVHKVHAVWDRKPQMRKGTAMGSQNWVEMQEHPNMRQAIGHLKAQNMQILVTNLSAKSVDFREIDYTLPTAIILGQEKHGATQEAIDMADHDIIVPMVGMVQSLNVSVAAALILYEAQRQRQIAGMYDTQQLSEQACQEVLFKGGFPILTELCDRKGLPYPKIDQNGNIDADKKWWEKIRQTKESLINTD